MKFKKILASVVSSLFLFSCLTVPITVNADKAIGDEYPMEGIDFSKTEIKPQLSVNRIEIPLNIAKDNPNQTVELKISNCSSSDSYNGVYGLGVHLKFDRRLEILKSNNRYSEDEEMVLLDLKEPNTLFLVSFPVWDGETWRFHVKLPSDIQVGDIYPISIMYKKNENATDMCIDKDKSNNAMEAWAFTQGVEHGYIRITNNDPTYILKNSDSRLGDPNGDGVINAVDASTILTYYANISTNKAGGLDEAQKTAADVDKNGVINAVDASIVLSYYAYTSTTKEPESFTDYLAKA